MKTYNPKLPLHQQVKKIDGGQNNTVDLLGVPYTFGVVNFEPLLIKDKAYKISLTKKSSVGRENGQVFIYDKLTFKLEEEGGGLIGENISADEIDSFMKGVHDKAFDIIASSITSTPK